MLFLSQLYLPLYMPKYPSDRMVLMRQSDLQTEQREMNHRTSKVGECREKQSKFLGVVSIYILSAKPSAEMGTASASECALVEA